MYHYHHHHHTVQAEICAYSLVLQGKHCQHKLQRVMTTMSASGVSALVDGKSGKLYILRGYRDKLSTWVTEGVDKKEWL